jgi:hypothetical protein
MLAILFDGYLIACHESYHEPSSRNPARKNHPASQGKAGKRGQMGFT